MTSPAPGAIVCPRCNTPSPPDQEWRFCAACGAPLAGAVCAGCNSPLTAGARFCHRCGAAAGASAATTPAGAGGFMPWAVAGIALLALFALLAGRGFARRGGGELDAPQNALPQEGLDFARPGAQPRAPDISQLSPEERADRLFNRVMSLASEGKRDSVLFFAPMAIQAYAMIAPLDADQHYDVGRIAEVAGALPLARAHADSILARQPAHLLGLILSARIASLQRDSGAVRRYERLLLAAERAEMARRLPEYERHQDEIAAALATARASIR